MSVNVEIAVQSLCGRLCLYPAVCSLTILHKTAVRSLLGYHLRSEHPFCAGLGFARTYMRNILLSSAMSVLTDVIASF